MNAVNTLALKSVPTVNFRNVITSFTGVRSSTKGGDFIIGESAACSQFINVAAIDSPGLTCCISIAEYVMDVLKDAGLKLELNADFNGKRCDPHFFRKMNDDEKNEFIKSNPTYGRIVCRCEGISEGEMRYAIRTNPPATDLDGVKRRTRAGMGRCQGGFCSPTVMKLIAEERGIGKEQVTKNGGGSYIVTEKL
jgi:glycerol-3-phosphate dehydrogenase